MRRAQFASIGLLVVTVVAACSTSNQRTELAGLSPSTIAPNATIRWSASDAHDLVVRLERSLRPEAEAHAATGGGHSTWIPVASPRQPGETRPSTLRVDAPPARTGGATHLEIDGRPDLSIDIEPEGLRDVVVESVQHAGVAVDAAEATDVVYEVRPGSFEELRLLRNAGAPHVARYRIRWGASIGRVVAAGARVQVLDRDGYAVIGTEPIVAADARGERREARVAISDVDGGAVVVVDLDAQGLEYPILLDPAWIALGARVPIGKSRAVRLKSGKVFVLNDKRGMIFDPKTLGWTATAPMITPRPGCPALLADGKVLVAGRDDRVVERAAAEIYDPATDRWKEAAPMTGTGWCGTALLLPDNRVFVGDDLEPPQIFDPVRDRWSVGAKRLNARTEGPTYTLLKSGKVLAAGGVLPLSLASPPWARGAPLTERYDPATDTWSPAPPMKNGRSWHAATRLSDGRVLVVGGITEDLGPSANPEIFDPATDSWRTSASAKFGAPRGMELALLSTGNVLVVGGTDQFRTYCLWPHGLYDPVLDRWQEADSPRACRRYGHSVTALDDGFAVVLGGAGGRDASLEGEIFVPFGVKPACTGDAECPSKHCVDGVCCSSTCSGPCEACDQYGAVGICSKVPGGAPHGTRSCGAYLCASGACGSKCSSEGDCAPGNRCILGSCVPPSEDGTPCTAASECVSRACVDGVCCDSKCAEPCSACDFVTALGRCRQVFAGPPHGDRSCGLGVCRRGSCSLACDNDRDCPKGLCIRGRCDTPQRIAAACARDAECESGHCVDGFCCTSACDGLCEACGEDRAVGLCVPIRGRPRGERPACPSAGADSCASRACDGMQTASCEGYALGPSATCGFAECERGGFREVGTCSADHTCVFPPRRPCAPYACQSNASACLTSCSSTAQCASGFECNVRGECVPPSAGKGGDGGKGDGGGGCQIAGRAPPGGPARLDVVILALAATVARLRRARRASRTA